MVMMMVNLVPTFDFFAVAMSVNHQQDEQVHSTDKKKDNARPVLP